MFDKYIQERYEIKRDTKDPIRRNLAKLRMNSLYGKFGMNPISEEIKRVKSQELAGYLEENKSFEIVSEGFNYSLVKTPVKTHNMSPLEVLEFETGMPSDKQKAKYEAGSRSNVAIAAAITAYARIALSNHMMDPNNPVFYHDTDSIVVQNPLPAAVVGKELGQMKLEYTIRQGVFAGPKLYSIITDEDKPVVKAKGYGSKGLSHKEFEGLLEGEVLRMTKEY